MKRNKGVFMEGSVLSLHCKLPSDFNEVVYKLTCVLFKFQALVGKRFNN